MVLNDLTLTENGHLIGFKKQTNKKKRSFVTRLALKKTKNLKFLDNFLQKMLQKLLCNQKLHTITSNNFRI